MVRPKRSSDVLQKAQRREAGLRTIEEKLDLGNGRTLSQYSQDIQELRDAIAIYNSTLSTLDDLARDIKAAELKLRESSEHMLLGVAAKYGKDSREYGKAGGTLKSERKRLLRQPKTVTAQTSRQPTAEPTLRENLPLLNLNGQKNVSLNGNGNGNGKALVI